MLPLAHRFLLSALVEHLGGLLSASITAVNFTQMALLADTYECLVLKKVMET